MSSMRLSVSGQRGYSLDTYPDRTTFTTPSKPDDQIRVQMSSVGVIEAVLPSNARVEVREKDGSQYLVLVLPGMPSLTVIGIAPEAGGYYPHIEVDARKSNPAFTQSLNPTDTNLDLKTLFSPTE